MDILLELSLKIGMAALTVALFILVAAGFSLKGPTRWVKTVTALLIVCFLVTEYLFFGMLAVVISAGVTLASTIFGIAFALIGWRFPINRQLGEAGAEACPAFARKSIDGWTQEFIACGFVHHADREGAWMMHGSERSVFIRFFKHHSDPTWVELHAVANPKIAARLIVSAKGEEGAVLTVDQQSDQEVLDDSLVVVQRLARNSTCQEMAESHRALAARVPGAYRTASDPVQAHQWVFFRWAQRMLAAGTVATDGQMIRLRPTQFPRLMLRMCTAWFH